ncbi:hypothetical protein HDU98_002443 [Podochytrium sp. JEL0797]|nr:hypothetical protein HDU98_002443 [Podochytrium sp. JEL0797]
MKLEFFFDIVCPYAYIASMRLENLRVQCDASDIVFTPVLLGGIYELTKAPQGKAGSATDVMNSRKSKVLSEDFQRTFERFKIPLNWNKKHPVRSLEALRLLHSVGDQNTRKRLTKALFKAYWVDNADVSDKKVLLAVAKNIGVNANASVFSDKKVSEALTAATSRVVQLGAPGVPFFYLPNTASNQPQTYWGQDRLHFIESHLAQLSFLEKNPASTLLPPPLAQQRLSKDSSFPLTRKRTLVFFWDFSSPWSYIAWNVVKERLMPLCGPNLKVVDVPILVGGIFKETGSGNILTLPPVKQAYGAKDMQDWIQYWNALPLPNQSLPVQHALSWPDTFPIRSILPSRVALLFPETTSCIFDASWSYNEDVATPMALEHVLVEEGYSDVQAAEMMDKTHASKEVKKMLWENGQRASKIGVFGVPSFVVCECKEEGGKGCECGGIVWGQDRIMDVVADLLVGDEKGVKSRL